jgi:hypothetical protein
MPRRVALSARSMPRPAALVPRCTPLTTLLSRDGALSVWARCALGGLSALCAWPAAELAAGNERCDGK